MMLLHLKRHRTWSEAVLFVSSSIVANYFNVIIEQAFILTTEKLHISRR